MTRFTILFLAALTSGCQTGLAYLAPLTSIQQIAIDDMKHARELALREGRDVDVVCLDKFIVAAEFVQEANMGANGIFVQAQISKTVRERYSPSCMALLTGFR